MRSIDPATSALRRTPEGIKKGWSVQHGPGNRREQPVGPTAKRRRVEGASGGEAGEEGRGGSEEGEGTGRREEKEERGGVDEAGVWDMLDAAESGGILSARVLSELRKGIWYWAEERRICRILASRREKKAGEERERERRVTVEEVDAASECKSFDYRGG